MRSVGFQPAEPINVWAVSDGRAGIENQAVGLAEALARRTPIRLTTKRVQDSRAVVVAAERASCPPRAQRLHRVRRHRSRLGPTSGSAAAAPRFRSPWACGDWSNAATLVVQLQDPRVNPREFDVVVPPIHDGLEGQNVLADRRRLSSRDARQGSIEAVLDYPAPLEDMPLAALRGADRRQVQAPGHLRQTRARHRGHARERAARNRRHADGDAVAAHQRGGAAAISHLARAALRGVLRRRRRSIPISRCSARPTTSSSPPTASTWRPKPPPPASPCTFSPSTARRQTRALSPKSRAPRLRAHLHRRARNLDLSAAPGNRSRRRRGAHRLRRTRAPLTQASFRAAAKSVVVDRLGQYRRGRQFGRQISDEVVAGAKHNGHSKRYKLDRQPHARSPSEVAVEDCRVRGRLGKHALGVIDRGGRSLTARSLDFPAARPSPCATRGSSSTTRILVSSSIACFGPRGPR